MTFGTTLVYTIKLDGFVGPGSILAGFFFPKQNLWVSSFYFYMSNDKPRE